ncbi:MAG: glycosyltransferase family 39 protein [Thermoguttaceae bacterium]|nr:glycosyltransferase family 39 protein [Thermoguttaceae bacterium]
MERSIDSNRAPAEAFPSFENPPRAGALVRAFLVGAAALVLVLAASEELPPTWDEGDTAARTDTVLAWSKKALSLRRAEKSLWSASELRHAFPCTVSREGHPAGYVVLSAAGKAFLTRTRLAGGGKLLSEKAAYRFGAIFLFSAALGAVFYRVEREFSGSAACFAVLSIVLLPRVFTHAQIAFGDSPLISGWLLSWAFFPRGKAGPSRWLLWGVFLGLTAAAKFTGAIAFFPFLIWSLCRNERRALLSRLALGAAAACFTFWLLNPPIWHAPASGLAKYFYLNTHRGAYDIGIFFLGRIYSLSRPLPWWNSLFWTAVTVPVGILVSALAFLAAAAVQSVRRRENAPENGSFFTGLRRGEIGLLFWNWILPVAVRAFPGLPVHDGVRLFAAAFPFLAILGGLGLARLWMSKGIALRAAALLVLCGSASSFVLYFPQGLSYYNLLIGGLPGAARAGMEAAYYWDGLDREVGGFLNRGTAGEAARPVLFGAASPATLRRWTAWDLVPARSETIASFSGLPDARRRLSETPFGYYILQNRASGLAPVDRKLLRTHRPVWYKTAGMWQTPKLLKNTPWDLSRVPLVLIYKYETFLDAAETPTDR